MVSVSQGTLGGDVVELERRTCDVYADDICGREAAYQVGDVAACETCAAEITEPEHPDDAENATKLRATDRLVTDGGQVEDGIDQLAPGTVLRRGETLFIVERGPTNAGDVVVGELGSRELKNSEMYDIGDDCPVPACDGNIVESEVHQARRQCSEGCLEWLPDWYVDGQDCPNCENGTVVEDSRREDRYSADCDNEEHQWSAFGTKKWREAWWPQAKEDALRSLSPAGDHSGGGE